MYVINREGYVILHSAHPKCEQKSDNYFRDLYGAGNPKASEQMKRDIRNNRNGFIETTIAGREIFSAYTPIEKIHDWYLITSVPNNAVSPNGNTVISIFYFILFVIVVIFTSSLTYFLWYKNKQRAQLEKIAFVDTVTLGDTYNKFLVDAQGILTQCPHKKFHIIKFDIDNFKLLNDMYGFREGDEILVGINQLLSRMDSGRDLHARLSDDNFIWLVNCLTEEEAVSKIRQFNDAFQGTMSQDQKGYKLGFTFGAYKIHPKNMDVDKIIDRAAMAHQSAKLLHADPKVVFYDEKIRNDAIRIKTIENMMYDALANREFVVYLQPKYNVSTSTIEGAEALVRWVRDGKVIPPSEFISIFERNGFIVNMDMYVLEEVCRLQRKWLDMGLNPVPISINQSRSLVYSKDYVDKLYGVITRYDLPARLIEVELLETIIHDNVTELISIIRQLRRIGLLICIDDFGSGYSSLNMLKDFDVDVLKIDREFLNNAEISERAKYVLAQIITLAKGLKMIVVTEGVETEKQAGLLKELECDTAQGFFYARPMPCEQFEKLLSVPGRTRTFESSREDQLNHELT